MSVPAPLVPMLDRLRSQPALRLGARATDSAHNTGPPREDGLHRDVVVVPVIVCPALSFRPGPFRETARHLRQHSSVCPGILATQSGLVGGSAIVDADFAAANRDKGAQVAFEAGAGHGHAEAIADADVKVRPVGADGPLELRARAPVPVAVFGYRFRAPDKHGAGVGETDAAEGTVSKAGGFAAGAAVEPVGEAVVGGAKGDTDSAAAAATAGCDWTASRTRGGVGGCSGGGIGGAYS